MRIGTLILVYLIVWPVLSPLYGQERAGERPFYDPSALFLTWQSDPTTTMTIDWHVIDEDRTYMEVRRMGTSSWSDPLQAEAIDFPWSNRTVHRVEVTGLEPGSRYEFRFGESSRIYNFRTMPENLSRPVRIAVGGDTMHRRTWMEETAREALKHDPDFILIAGDLAYAAGLPPEKQRQRDSQNPRVRNQWYSWFDAYREAFITEDSRVVPMVVSIGNAEIRGAFYDWDDRRPDDPPYRDDDSWRANVAPYFFSLFAMPGLPGYGVLDVGSYLSIILLDSDHANPVESQNEWLEHVLSERSDVPHLFPVYHIPAWPSVRDHRDPRNRRVRENWVPLFERYDVHLVFEAHDHAYKRTHPIRSGQIDPAGIVYVGDGAWGTSVREIGLEHAEPAWYLAATASERHFILLTLHETQRHMQVINSRGETIDEYPARPVPRE